MAGVGTAKGERRRQELVAAAADLLRHGGFDAVRHRAVAERAGLPLASTTYYFASLDDLVTAAVERSGRIELDEGRAQLDAFADWCADPAALAEVFLDLLVGSESRHGGLDAVLLRYERLVGAGRRPYLAPLMRQMRVELDALLAEIATRSGRRWTRSRCATSSRSSTARCSTRSSSPTRTPAPRPARSCSERSRPARKVAERDPQRAGRALREPGARPAVVARVQDRAGAAAVDRGAARAARSRHRRARRASSRTTSASPSTSTWRPSRRASGSRATT